MNETPEFHQDAARLGVDIGGTKLEAAALGPDGLVRVRRRTPTPRGYDELLAALVGLVADVESEAGPCPTVGVGHPGSISPRTGLIRNANSTWLNGRNLRQDLEAELNRDVRLANDADCFALSEAVDGAGAGAPIVFGVILGTGVGGGVAIDGRQLSGAQGIAGEWGHNPLPWPRPDERAGPVCWCGKQGCLEAWISGPGMSAAFERATGRSLTPAEIEREARAGSPVAQGALDDYADRLARGLATVLNVIDAHRVVLGGGVSNIAGLCDAAAKRLPQYVFSDHVATEIVKNRHGDSSGVRGAAWLWTIEEARAAASRR